MGTGNRLPDNQLIIDGEMDQYPEAAFFNVGTIDDVIEKAKSMEH